MFSRGTDSCACVHRARYQRYQTESSESLLEEEDVCRGRGSERNLASSVMILQEEFSHVLPDYAVTVYDLNFFF